MFQWHFIKTAVKPNWDRNPESTPSFYAYFDLNKMEVVGVVKQQVVYTTAQKQAEGGFGVPDYITMHVTVALKYNTS